METILCIIWMNAKCSLKGWGAKVGQQTSCCSPHPVRECFACNHSDLQWSEFCPSLCLKRSVYLWGSFHVYVSWRFFFVEVFFGSDCLCLFSCFVIEVFYKLYFSKEFLCDCIVLCCLCVLLAECKSFRKCSYICFCRFVCEEVDNTVWLFFVCLLSWEIQSEPLKLFLFFAN